jgi:protease I
MIKKSKSAVFVIAFKDFRDPEFFIPQTILSNTGVKTFTASNKEGIAVGVEGGEVEIDFLLDNLKVKDFDAVIFVGGIGASVFMNNSLAHKIVRDAVINRKILGAICVGPTILANAGVLKGVRATVWASSMDKSAIRVLEENGACFEPKTVVIDGKIITANGPNSAEEFGNKLVQMMAS